MRISISFVICMLIAGCQPKIVHYLNERAPIQSFESYSLVNVKTDNKEVSKETRSILEMIGTSIKAEMENKRFYVSSNINPDLILRYEIVSSTSTQTRNNNNLFNPFSTFSTQAIYQSILLLQLYHDKKLIWQGSYDLNQSRRDERNERLFEKAIQRIFTTYPYKAKSNKVDEALTSVK